MERRGENLVTILTPYFENSLITVVETTGVSFFSVNVDETIGVNLFAINVDGT